MNIGNFLGLALFASCLCAFFLIWLNPIARRIGLVDKPTERKTHGAEVPLIGGICVVLTLCLTLLISPIQLQPYREFFFAGICLVIVGVLDDSRDIQPKAKLFAQLVIVSVLILQGDLLITEIGDIWGVGYNQGTGIFAIPFTVVCLLVAINACNMIDGHDGVLASTTVLSLLGLAYLLYRAEERVDLQIILLLCVVLLPFIVLNIGFSINSARKIFLGDAGSMFLGIFLIFFAIKTSRVEFTGLSLLAVPFILGLPALDFFRVIVVRALSRRPLWQADRDHLHHMLKERGLPDLATLAIMLFVHVMMIGLGVSVSVWRSPDPVIVLSYLASLLVYFVFVAVVARPKLN